MTFSRRNFAFNFCSCDGNPLLLGLVTGAASEEAVMAISSSSRGEGEAGTIFELFFSPRDQVRSTPFTLFLGKDHGLGEGTMKLDVGRKIDMFGAAGNRLGRFSRPTR
jgi:hypothetical protein